MRFISLVLATLALLVAPINAQENKEERFDYGGDVYVAQSGPKFQAILQMTYLPQAINRSHQAP